MRVLFVGNNSWLLAFCAIFFVLSPALADVVYREITAPEVKIFWEKEGEVLLVMVLSQLEYELHHIPGSVNIPFNKLDDSSLLPADKSRPLVFYCMGYLWPYSEQAARIAVTKGYTDVYWFRGGISEWRSFNYPLVIDNAFKGIKVNKLTPSEVQEYVARGNVLIFDVRPRNLRKYTHFIAGANSFPLLTLVENSSMLPKNQPIILTDGTMRQSPLAAKYLSANGFNVLGVLKGGLVRWESEGFPVEQRGFFGE